VRVSVERDDDGALRFKPIAGSEFQVPTDLVVLAMGFTGPRRELLTQLGVELTPSGAVKTDYDHRTTVPGIFAAGDARRGASLIVWAIREGRDVATAVDAFLRDEARVRRAARDLEPATAGR
jgi:glutamate synthase (NADPH/NADH) small chain